MPLFKPPNFMNMADSNSADSGNFDRVFADSGQDFLNASLNGGEWVSAQSALQNSDLYAIISQLSSDLATVKLTANQKRWQGIMDNPSTNANRHGFYQSIYAQLLLAGEAFAYRWRNENGRDVKWEFLKPSQVHMDYYEYENGTYYNITFTDPRVRPLLQVPQSDVLHFKLVSLDGGRTGVSPLLALGRELKIKKASDDLTFNSLKNSLKMNGVLKIKNGGLLDNKTKMARSRSVMQQMTGGPLVLDDLEDFTPLEIKSNVAQLLSQADWTSKQFAKVYGIPDSYLGGQGDQQSSVEQISNVYANAMARYLRPIISEMAYKLGTVIDYDIRPSVDVLGTSYMSAVSNLVKTGVIDANQGQFMLQKSGTIPLDLPERQEIATQSSSDELERG